MKKTLIILSLLFSGFCIQAQTKEETVNWIKEKVTKYGRDVNYMPGYKVSNCYNTNTNINGNLIICKDYQKEYDRLVTSAIQLDDIVDVKQFPIKENKEDGYIHLLTKGFKVKWDSKWQNDGSVTVSESSGFYLRLQWDAEPDLFNRVYKAMQKLASYNMSSLPKEAF